MTSADLVERLTSRRTANVGDAISEAVLLGDDGEFAIAAAWEAATPYGRLMMAAALGDRRAPGPADDLLRDAIRVRGAGTQDLRCASMMALAKRVGAASTPDAVAAMSGGNGALAVYAIIALAATGDERGWSSAFQWFIKYRPGRYHGAPSIPALSFLIRTLAERPASDTAALVAQIRRKWPVLEVDGTAALLAAAWPEVLPDGPAEPDMALTANLGGIDWANHPLFRAAALP